MISPFETLDAVRAFLADTLLAETPAHLRSELRAAIKLLAETGAQLDALPALLPAESGALLDLIDEAGATQTEDLRCRLAAGPAALTDQLALQDAIGIRVGEVLCALHGRSDPAAADLAARIVATLAGQAQARLGWQSVFATGEEPG
ncbi:hypothetical protein [Novosphingobium colocasiae]|uniref:Uncharacterized protein n=1 Tax=Novosphingobium colocasiae TaxID=1256513 RepID=A0A918P9J4_9SPHN|nr:hypothetical protein [Novosphingobium colocasiae]GGY90738.1 hypothetical protein GCM10011614_01770 [Novosphingobium colocasiae]